jgi:sugar (pentulose or hexulose) kinase
VLAALSGGLTEPGGINNVCGTCEITCVCVDQPVASPNFNVRCHVIPGLWLTFFVLNTGGKALEWFHSVFCADMPESYFYQEYIPSVLALFFDSPDRDRLEQNLPLYSPFLSGSRYTLDKKTAAFDGVTLETNRDALLLSIIRGNAMYHGQHLSEVSGLVRLGRRVITSGGVAKIPRFMQVKQRWMGNFEYQYQDQSSLLGAAMLARFRQQGSGSLGPHSVAASRVIK